MTNHATIREQFRRNTVALISLAVAVTSLGYNTWRNEASEDNRNHRLISIEVLRYLGQLQQVVYHRHYDMDISDKGNPRTGWAIVLMIRDLASVLEPQQIAAAGNLHAVWDDNWNELGHVQASNDRIIAAIEKTRRDVHALLRQLD